MTLTQFEAARQHYNEAIKKQIEEDVLDHEPPGSTIAKGEVSDPSPDDDRASQGESGAGLWADGPCATPAQIAQLKDLARRVGDDAYADIQDMLDHHPEGIVVGVYEIIMQRLRARKVQQKQEA